MDEHERAYYRDLVDQKKGIMFQMEWFRIILDEAQYLPFSSKANRKLYQKS
jgi:SNF2 family DNA or RNA helicase